MLTFTMARLLTPERGLLRAANAAFVMAEYLVEEVEEDLTGLFLTADSFIKDGFVVLLE